MNISTSWRDYFSGLPSNEQGNKTSSLFSQATFSDLEAAVRLKNVTASMDYVIATVDSSNKIQLLHSVVNCGGTLIRNENKILALIGDGGQSIAVIVDSESLVNACIFKGPKAEEVSSCKSLEEISELEVPRTGATNFKGSACFVLAPFLRDAILAADTNDPNELILVALKAASDFNSLHDGDEEFGDGSIHSNDFSLWAWGVSNGHITETKLMIRPNDSELSMHQFRRQSECIQLSGSSLNTLTSKSNDEILNQLQVSISMQTEAAEISNNLRREELDRKIEAEEFKRDRTKRLHPSCKNMILMASSFDGDLPAENLVAACNAFFNKENEALADQELCILFEQRGMANVGFAHGLVQSLRSGFFTWALANSPSNFSVFCFYEANLTANDKQQRQMLLHLMTANTQGLSEETIQKISKQTVKIPADFESMNSQIEFFQGANEIMFGELSASSKGLTSLLQQLKLNKAVIKPMMEANKDLAAQFLFAIDIKIQRWLGQCKHAKDRSEVDDRLVDFKDLMDEVLDQKFSRVLPPSFSQPQPSLEDGTDEPQPKKRKKGKKGDETDGRKVTNPSVLPEFKVVDDNEWKSKFCGRCIEDRPVWKEVQNGQNIAMCPRWHSRGFCFKDCHNAQSHVEPDKVPANKKAEYQSYLKKVRGQDA